MVLGLLLVAGLATGLAAELVTALATGLMDWLVGAPTVVATAAVDAEADPELPFRPRSILAATWVVGALRPVVGLVTELVACLVTAPVLALKEGATEAMVGGGGDWFANQTLFHTECCTAEARGATGVGGGGISGVAGVGG